MGTFDYVNFGKVMPDGFTIRDAQTKDLDCDFRTYRLVPRTDIIDHPYLQLVVDTLDFGKEGLPKTTKDQDYTGSLYFYGDGFKENEKEFLSCYALFHRGHLLKIFVHRFGTAPEYLLMGELSEFNSLEASLEDGSMLLATKMELEKKSYEFYSPGLIPGP